MSLPGDSIKVSLIFTRTGGEEAETGFWVGLDTVGVTPSQANLDTWANAVWTQFSTDWTPLKAYASPDTKPSRLHASFYLAGSDTAALASEVINELPAGSSAVLHPYQCSIVASLRTAVPTRQGRGRMYWPLDGITISAAGQYNAGLVNTIGARIATFLTAVNALNVGATNATVVVASQTGGTARSVLKVITDSVPDIQRRRANRLNPITINTSAVT